jgi:hypothetical protein
MIRVPRVKAPETTLPQDLVYVPEVADMEEVRVWLLEQMDVVALPCAVAVTFLSLLCHLLQIQAQDRTMTSRDEAALPDMLANPPETSKGTGGTNLLRVKLPNRTNKVRWVILVKASNNKAASSQVIAIAPQ